MSHQFTRAVALMAVLGLCLLLQGATLAGPQIRFPADGTDPRCARITENELREIVNHKPLDSPVQLESVRRARNWDLQAVAYRLYTGALKAHPRNKYAMLLAGITTQDFFEVGVQKGLKPNTPARQLALMDLQKTAGDLLLAATQADSHWGLAASEYGYFEAMEKTIPDTKTAIHFLNLGVTLAPEDPTTHYVLGFTLVFTARNLYEPKRGEQELLKAIALDDRYAAPHMRLAMLYYQQHRYHEAGAQLDRYLRLMPEVLASRNPGLAPLKQAIAAKLKGS